MTSILTHYCGKFAFLNRMGFNSPLPRLYTEKMNRYGVPLDSRMDYTKLDWLVWTTVMTENDAYKKMVFDAVFRFINETPDRVPMTDWFYTSVPRMREFQNRSVVGGLFINMLDTVRTSMRG